MKTKNKNKFINGFTLIEMAIVMGIFLFVISAAVGIFLSIVANQKKILAEQQLLNQLSYAQEYMSKALRAATKEGLEATNNCLVDSSNSNSELTGYTYLFTNYDVSSSLFRGIRFLNQSDHDNLGNALCQEFFVEPNNNTQPVSATNPLVIKETKYMGGYGDVTDAKTNNLTPAGLTINSVRFSLNGSDGSASNCGGKTTSCGTCDNNSNCPAFYADPQPRVTILMDVQIPQDSLEPERVFETTVSQRNLNQK